VTGRRQNFGLPDNAFVALTVCDLRSSLARKNPLGAMEAFTMAFGTGGRQILLVKVGGIRGNETTFRFLEQKVASAPNVRLLTETLSPAGMEALISCVDVLVSLHRAEGFGLVPAQAMRAGKPVVATEWSGPKDFLTADNAALVPANLVPVDDPQGLYGDPGSVWAEPDLATAANHLRRLAESPDTARILGERAREDMRRFCSLERYWSTLGAPFRAASRARP
jgi:glycosyltransferase involved in cell wall biosynthesis